MRRVWGDCDRIGCWFDLFFRWLLGCLLVGRDASDLLFFVLLVVAVVSRSVEG